LVTVKTEKKVKKHHEHHHEHHEHGDHHKHGDDHPKTTHQETHSEVSVSVQHETGGGGVVQVGGSGGGAGGSMVHVGSSVQAQSKTATKKISAGVRAITDAKNSVVDRIRAVLGPHSKHTKLLSQLVEDRIEEAICIQLQEHALADVFFYWAGAARAIQRTYKKEITVLQRQLHDTSTEHTTLVLEAQAELKVRLAFSGWKDLYQQRKHRHLYTRYVTKSQETSKRMFSMLLSSQFEVLQKACFVAWCDALTEVRQDNELREMMAENMRALQKAEEAEQRMTSMLEEAEEKLMLKVAFVGWRDDVIELRQEEEFQRMARENRNLMTKSEQGALRMLVMLMGSQEDLMVTTIFNVWRDDVINARLEGRVFKEVEALQLKLKAHGAEHTKRFLGMLMGGQATLLKKSMYAAWVDLLKEQKEQKKILRIKQAMSNKGGESAKRMLRMLMDSQDSMLLKSSFAGFRDLVSDLRVARLREDQAAMMTRADRSTRRMLTMLMGNQDDLMVKTIFSVWTEVCLENRREREVDRLRSQMKAASEVHSKRFLGMLLGSQAELLAKAVFSAWCELLVEAAQNADVENLRLEMKRKGMEQSKRMLTMLMSSQDEMVMKAAFKGWQEVVVETHQAFQVDNLRLQMKQKGDESIKRFLTMLMGTQDQLLLKAAFSGWQEIIVENKQAQDAEHLRNQMKEGKNATSRRMLRMLMSSQGEVLLKAAYASWHDLYFQQRQEREVHELRRGMKSKGNESAKRMLGMLLSSHSDVLKKAAFAGFREVVAEIKIARIKESNLHLKKV